MDDRVWVGPASRCPSGWTSVESIEAILANPATPAWVVVDDPSGVLREADFTNLYGHVPFARIERVVGSWRAGVGRTDPQWPLATLRREYDIPEAVPSTARSWSPLTSGYEDLASGDVIPDLTGLSFGIQIGDPELRAMWADWLKYAGGELSRDRRVDVLIRDDSTGFGDTAVSATRCVIVLTPDPWNFEASLDCLADDETGGEQLLELAVSVLDSPARVTQRLLAALSRVAL